MGIDISSLNNNKNDNIDGIKNKYQYRIRCW